MSYSITGQVNGSERRWIADRLDEVMKLWEPLAKHRLVPETQEPVTGLTLWFGDKRVTTLLEPYGP